MADMEITAFDNPIDNSMRNIKYLSEFCRKERVLIVLFSVSVFTINCFPQLAIILRYSLIPLSVLLLLKYSSFELLIFPLLFLDDTIGTYVAGRFTLIWFYFMLFIFKQLYGNRQNGLKITVKRSSLIALLMCIYFVDFGFFEHGIVYIKILFVTICSIVNGNKLYNNAEQFKRLQFMIICSTIITAISLVLGIGGEIENYDRKIGFGFTDPNYSASVCCVGLGTCLYIKSKGTKSTFLIIALSIVYILAIVMTASLSGIAISLAILLSKVIFTRGLKKKQKLVCGIGVVAILGVSVLVPWLGLDYFNSVVSRIGDLHSSQLTANYLTTGRTSIAEQYLAYFSQQNIIGVLFGGNVLQCDDMYMKIGIRAVTHNAYIDHLLVFGLIGSAVMAVLYAIRIRLYSAYQKHTLDGYGLMMITIKLSLLAFGASLAYLEASFWWFLLLI